MFAKLTKQSTAATLLIGLATSAMGHGLVESPPSRGIFCGLQEQPHNPSSQACIDAFQGTGNDGYHFMSIRTWSEGRKSQLSTHVCSFDSEVVIDMDTLWDKPIDWPTTTISAGMNTFVWDIKWGPKFEDTEEFVYYITKPDFEYRVGVPLSWADFEDEPFCDLSYDDENRAASPNVIPDDTYETRFKPTFSTICNVPQRSGRHVIYAEWGRDENTFERFHSCMDVEISSATDPDADVDIDVD